MICFIDDDDNDNDDDYDDYDENYNDDDYNGDYDAVDGGGKDPDVIIDVELEVKNTLYTKARQHIISSHLQII